MHLAHCPFKGEQITTYNAIQNVMYALTRKNGHAIWREQWYALTWRISLQPISTWLEKTKSSLPMWWLLTQHEIVSLNVINWPTNVAVEFNTIIKFCKYRGFHEGHHFISMAMEMHCAPRHDMDRFIRECALLFHDRQLGGHLSLSFCNQFFKQCVSIVLQYALASTIERKIGKWCLF
jgi:hypothetical protein